MPLTIADNFSELNNQVDFLCPDRLSILNLCDRYYYESWFLGDRSFLRMYCILGINN